MIRYETTTKNGYRKLAFAYVGQTRVGHIGWVPRAVRNRREGRCVPSLNGVSIGMYSAFQPDGSTKIGEAETLAGAKKLLAAWVAVNVRVETVATIL